MVKRSTVTGIYDRVHKFGVVTCWVTALAAGSVMLLRSIEIIFFPQKAITVEDLPEYKRIMALKEKENEELLKE